MASIPTGISSCLLLSLLLLLLPAGANSDEGNEVNVQEEPGAEEPAVIVGRGNALRLNAHTFNGNVLRNPDEEVVENWIVSFCPNWFEPCQKLALPFDQLGLGWERKLNTMLLTKKVRFAMVDCATDKVLCNEQDVQQYPTVHHYQGGKLVATWRGGRAKDAEKLAKFLNKYLGPGALAAKPPEDLALSGVEAGGLVARLAPGNHTIDVALVVLVLTLNAWAVFSNPQLWQKPTAGAIHEHSAFRYPGTPHCRADKAAVSEHAEGVARFLPEGWGGVSSMEL